MVFFWGHGKPDTTKQVKIVQHAKKGTDVRAVHAQQKSRAQKQKDKRVVVQTGGRLQKINSPVEK